MENKYKILVITTGGCDACKLVHQNVIKAINIVNKTDIIDLQVQDFSNADKEFLSRYKIGDFPAVFLIKVETVNNDAVVGDTTYEKVVFKFYGLRTAIIIARYIDLYMFDNDWGCNKNNRKLTDKDFDEKEPDDENNSDYDVEFDDIEESDGEVFEDEY